MAAACLRDRTERWKRTETSLGSMDDAQLVVPERSLGRRAASGLLERGIKLLEMTGSLRPICHRVVEMEVVVEGAVSKSSWLILALKMN